MRADENEPTKHTESLTRLSLIERFGRVNRGVNSQGIHRPKVDFLPKQLVRMEPSPYSRLRQSRRIDMRE
ncbi:hypothetical protein JTE90_003733 [Oedothorax gibbosus]|uniref:Uncharacterized protein n=1 Tax=Oedothorax gibbosus TaxID=931172 RepID=A0AAV6VAM0_9ARAC|nr:hypothetical protein JTE90_003733 [Oedothorax gibbosus]